MSASQATGLGNAKASEPSGLGPTGAIPRAKLTANELLALKAWAGTSEDYGCLSFKDVTDYSGLPRHLVRRTVRSMARKGLAKFYSGLSDDDGNFKGSGYALTRDGRDLLWQHHEEECWKYEGL
jgi:DNA-binding MarR family transcriptional regulator